MALEGARARCQRVCREGEGLWSKARASCMKLLRLLSHTTRSLPLGASKFRQRGCGGGRRRWSWWRWKWYVEPSLTDEGGDGVVPATGADFERHGVFRDRGQFYADAGSGSSERAEMAPTPPAGFPGVRGGEVPDRSTRPASQVDATRIPFGLAFWVRLVARYP